MTIRTPLAMLVGTVLLGSGCAANTSDETGAARSVDEVTDSPDRHIGRTITVQGEVDDVRSARAFTLEDHDWVFPDELLVLAPNEPDTAAPADFEDRDVTVTGTVRRLNVVEVEREWDLDVGREFQVEFRDRPILVAERITRGPSSRRSAGDRNADTTTTMVRAAPVTDLLVLVPVPGAAELVGQEVRLTDVEVRSRVDDRGFWIGPSHTRQVFVRLADEALIGHTAAVDAGDRVSLTGTIRRVPGWEQVRNQWGLDETQAGLVARNEALYIEADGMTRES